MKGKASAATHQLMPSGPRELMPRRAEKCPTACRDSAHGLRSFHQLLICLVDWRACSLLCRVWTIKLVVNSKSSLHGIGAVKRPSLCSLRGSDSRYCWQINCFEAATTYHLLRCQTSPLRVSGFKAAAQARGPSESEELVPSGWLRTRRRGGFPSPPQG
jgi:hypothetical protein